MGEAKILMRSDAVAAAFDPAEIERKLSLLEVLWNDGFIRKSVIILFLVEHANARFFVVSILTSRIQIYFSLVLSYRCRSHRTSPRRRVHPERQPDQAMANLRTRGLAIQTQALTRQKDCLVLDPDHSRYLQAMGTAVRYGC